MRLEYENISIIQGCWAHISTADSWNAWICSNRRRLNRSVGWKTSKAPCDRPVELFVCQHSQRSHQQCSDLQRDWDSEGKRPGSVQIPDIYFQNCSQHGSLWSRLGHAVPAGECAGGVLCSREKNLIQNCLHPGSDEPGCFCTVSGLTLTIKIPGNF